MGSSKKSLREFLLANLIIMGIFTQQVGFALSAKVQQRPSESGGYSFYDPSPQGAFETSVEQLRMASEQFERSGAQSFVDRFEFFDNEDKKTLLVALGRLKELPKITFNNDSVDFEGHRFSFRKNIFIIDEKEFVYDLNATLATNAKLAANLLQAKVSWIERTLQIVTPLPSANAGAGIGLAIAGVVAALLGGLFILNSKSSARVDEKVPGGGHLSLGARLSGLGNYLSTAYTKPSGNALEEGLAASKLPKYQNEFTNKDYMVIVDYKNCRNQDSFFVVDRRTGAVMRSYKIPTAYGSTDRAAMCTLSCSDRNKSHQSEAGAMVTTGTWGQGKKTGEGILLRGLEAKNKNTESREIKIHEGRYKEVGNSAGCFVLSRSEIEGLKQFVRPGTFVYAANCPSLK